MNENRQRVKIQKRRVTVVDRTEKKTEWDTWGETQAEITPASSKQRAEAGTRDEKLDAICVLDAGAPVNTEEYRIVDQSGMTYAVLSVTPSRRGNVLELQSTGRLK